MKRILCSSLLLAILAISPVAPAESAKMAATLESLAAVKGPFTFAVIGDNRSGDRVYKKVIGLMMARDPIFVINTGDVIPNPGNRSQWANFREISKAIPVPYFLAAGNHDIDDRKSQDVWRDEVDLPGNETWYSFTVGRSLFVVLNSYDPDDEHRIAGKQFAWLARTLDPKKYDHQFVFVHDPVFMWKGASHEGESLDRYPESRDNLHRLFVSKKVDAVIVGHEHTYRRLERDGIPYIVCGGAGAPLYGKESFNNFMIMRVDGPRVEAKALDRDGAMRDEFVLVRNQR